MSRGSRRPVADRGLILDAARRIGLRDGWEAVTIRALAQELRYTPPVLYQHFRDKADILTQLAAEGLAELDRAMRRDIPSTGATALLVMVERYWRFMTEHTRIYRLMNGMDGVPIDRPALAEAARRIFADLGRPVRDWAAAEGLEDLDAAGLVDELWALLHGMAMLQLDRAAPFDLQRAQRGVLKLLKGAGRV